MPYPLIMLTTTDQAQLALRRYASGACPASWDGRCIHDVAVVVGTASVTIDAGTGDWSIDVAEDTYRDDLRWPTTCTCGYVFTDDDESHVATARIYTRQDTGETVTMGTIAPGMVWDAPWFVELGWDDGAGFCPVVALPGGGEWIAYRPSGNGGKWTITGTWPHITASPSILNHPAGGMKGYHGWLADGILSDDLEGRTYQ